MFEDRILMVSTPKNFKEPKDALSKEKADELRGYVNKNEWRKYYLKQTEYKVKELVEKIINYE